jgi:hypothetical protein
MKITFKSLLASTLVVLLQRSPGAGSAIRKNLAERLPQLKGIDEVSKTPIPGVYELRVNGADIYYTDAQGNYLIEGNIIDLRARRNLTEERVTKLTAIKFDELPLKDAFTIVRGNGKRRLAVLKIPTAVIASALSATCRRWTTSPSTCSCTPSWAPTRAKNPKPSGAPRTRPRPGRTTWCATSRYPPLQRVATPPPWRAM